MTSFDIGIAEGMVKVAVSQKWVQRKAMAAVGKPSRHGGTITHGDLVSVGDNLKYLQRKLRHTDPDALRRMGNANVLAHHWH